MNKYFEEFMETNPDDIEYDDAIVLDKRKFCECVKENIKENQIIANTFITEDPLKPRSIKIMVFMLNLLLYFVVDALFINEEVVAEIFQADEEDTVVTLYESGKVVFQGVSADEASFLPHREFRQIKGLYILFRRGPQCPVRRKRLGQIDLRRFS